MILTPPTKSQWLFNWLTKPNGHYERSSSQISKQPHHWQKRATETQLIKGVTGKNLFKWDTRTIVNLFTSETINVSLSCQMVIGESKT